MAYSSPLKTSEQPECSVLIIGAGASGLAAGRRLKDAGINAVILEGRDRVGGRVFTNYDIAPHPIELGAEWILGDKALSWPIVKEAGFNAMPETTFDKYHAYLNQQLFNPTEFHSFEHAQDLFTLEGAGNAAFTWQETGRPDGTLSEIFDEAKIEKDMLILYQNRIALDFAAEASQLGVNGFMEADDTSYGEGYFRVEEGYDQLMKHLAKELDVKLNSAVKKIQWTHKRVLVHTRNGETFEADRVIITLPLAILQAGDVEFEPQLPTEKQAAIDGLGCGKVTKIVCHFKEKFWPDDITGIWTTMDTQTWYRPGQDRNNETNVLTGYIGGDASARFAALGEQATIKEAMRQLECMFSVENLSDKLQSVKVIVWANDEFSKMAYSYVPAGAAGLRDQLALPIENVLFFAGEATNRECAALVHGALQSGYRAADEVIKSNS